MTPEDLHNEIRNRVASTVRKYGPLEIMENLSQVGARQKMRGQVVLIPLHSEDFGSCRTFYEISLALKSYNHYWSRICRKRGEEYYPNSTVRESNLPQRALRYFSENFRTRWDRLESILESKHQKN
jgi:hypothetical protein